MTGQILKLFLAAAISAAVLIATIYAIVATINVYNQIDEMDLNTETCDKICADSWIQNANNQDQCCLNDNCWQKKVCQQGNLNLYSWVLKAQFVVALIAGISLGMYLCDIVQQILECCKGNQTENQEDGLNRLKKDQQEEKQVSLLSDSMQKSKRIIDGDHFYYDVVSRQRVKCLGMCPQCS